MQRAKYPFILLDHFFLFPNDISFSRFPTLGYSWSMKIRTAKELVLCTILTPGSTLVYCLTTSPPILYFRTGKRLEQEAVKFLR